MSSFIGHAVTAGAVFVSRKEARRDFTWPGVLWLAWLVVAAVTPDLDYFVPFLKKAQHGGLRISHSIAFALVIPLATMALLGVCRVRLDVFLLRAIQITLASLSHIVLDFLVSVHPLPLFWPLSPAVFRSPIGLLPSAGAIDLTNFYFYRNLAIEMGILLPIIGCIQLIIRRPFSDSRRRVAIGCLLAVVLVCIYIASALSRV